MGLHVGFHNGKDYPTALVRALASASSSSGAYIGLAPFGQIDPHAPPGLVVFGSDTAPNRMERVPAIHLLTACV